MIVKLLKGYTHRGVKFKKGQTIAVTRQEAIDLCQQEIAVSNEDIPCADRQYATTDQRFGQQETTSMDSLAKKKINHKK
jgi:hypothetical protein